MNRRAAGLALLLCALGVAPAAAWATEDTGPVATGESGRGGDALDDQIAAWQAAGEAPPPTPSIVMEPDRRPHGVVSVGVGTGGYRSVYAQTDLPVGRTGTLSLAIGDEQGRVFGRTQHARSLALGLSFDGSPRPSCPPGPGPKDAPWRRYDAVEMQRLQAACADVQP